MRQVSRVLYPGLEGQPYFPRVQKLFGGQAGGVVTFELLGGAAAAEMMFQVCLALSWPQTGAFTGLTLHRKRLRASILSALATLFSRRSCIMCSFTYIVLWC